jgi:hypothetical protein
MKIESGVILHENNVAFEGPELEKNGAMSIEDYVLTVNNNIDESKL